MPSADLPFRLRIGVTGHRIIKDPEWTAQKIRDILHHRIWEFFDFPVQREKIGSRIAFTLLSPLAEGADRLVAVEVFKTADSELEAVLPMAEEEYCRDFATAESRAEFHDLLGQARKITLIKEAGSDSGPAEFRKKAYEAAGRYVVDHCDLLIAIWDGEPARGRGGTAEIITYARSKNRPLVILSTDNTKDIRIEK